MHATKRQELLAEVEAKLGTVTYSQNFAEGERLSYHDAMTEALGWCKQASVSDKNLL